MAETSRRDFIRIGGMSAAGLVAAGASRLAVAQHEQHEAGGKQAHEGHKQNGQAALPQPEPIGAYGTPEDRGKLVSGYRSASEPPVEVIMPAKVPRQTSSTTVTCNDC